MKKQTKNIILGILLIGNVGCSSVPLRFRKQDYAYINEYKNVVSIGYDMNNNEKEDFRYYYRKLEDGTLKLQAVQKDRNRDGHFENNEFVWRKRMEIEDLLGGYIEW